MLVKKLMKPVLFLDFKKKNNNDKHRWETEGVRPTISVRPYRAVEKETQKHSFGEQMFIQIRRNYAPKMPYWSFKCLKKLVFP